MDENKKRAPYLVIACGLWLAATSLLFMGSSHLLLCSDLLSSFLLLFFGILSLKPSRQWSRWAIGGVGLWLQLAPIALWAPSAPLYLNDTLIGAIALVLAFILTKKTEVNPLNPPINPSGWSYNPSAWNHRIPTVGLALLCWFFSRYMAAYQLGYIDVIWDPFFKEGTLQVITSKISKGFPVSDAGLGAVCYTLEFLLGWQGDEGRWYKAPWLVLAFGFLVVPVGIISIILIILQPVAVGAWCSWCIATAFSMLLMIVLTAGELIATLQLLKKSSRKSRSLWSVLWKGASPDGGLNPLHGRPAWGVTIPWNLLLTIGTSVWLLYSTPLFYTRSDLSTVNDIAGPLLIAISLLSMAEVFRSARYLNIFIGVALIIAPLFYRDPSALANWNNVLIGIAVALLALPRGRVKEKYGTWGHWIF